MLMKNRHISIVLTDSLEKPELCRLLAAFAIAGRIHEKAYEVSLVSGEGKPVVSLCGEWIATDRLMGSRADTLMILGPNDPRLKRYPQALLSGLDEVATTVRRLAIVGTGAFVAAHAGLLEKREVQTDWRYAAYFRERFPQIPLRQEKEGPIVRPGYLASDRGQHTTDLALAMIEEDLGAGTARTVRFLTTINQLVEN